MLPNVPGLDLPAGGIPRRVGQDSTLEYLDQDGLVGAAYLDGGPVGFGDRVAGGVVGVFKCLGFGVHEVPED